MSKFLSKLKSPSINTHHRTLSWAQAKMSIICWKEPVMTFQNYRDPVLEPPWCVKLLRSLLNKILRWSSSEKAWVRVIFLKKRVFIGLLLFVTFCNGGSAKSIQIHRIIRGMKSLNNSSFSGIITRVIRNFIYPSKIDLQIESVIIRRICKLEMVKINTKFFRRYKSFYLI